MLERATMIRYMIPLLIFSVLSTADASNTEIKHQFTVTHIMLEMLQNQEEELSTSIPPCYDGNETISSGGDRG